jgi:hypothetical protein
MLQQKFNPNHDPGTGQFSEGGGSDGGGSSGGSEKPAGEKPAGGKGGKAKVSKVSDFDKAGIKVDHDTTINAAKAEKFLKIWNERVGEAPEDFKKDFIGVPGTMSVSYSDTGDKMTISGRVQEDGRSIGEYQRDIDLKNNSAYSAYFVLNSGERGAGVGKTLLASNVAMYQKLGLDKVSVSANIDVGGYAWAKYGYVPTQSSWNSLRADIIDKLSEDGSRSSHAASGSGYTPEEWSSIGDHDQSQIENAWMRSTREEFLDSEIQNWRDSGQALQQAKTDLANDFNDSQPKWATAAIETWRSGLEDEGKSIPYTNDEILAAISAEEYSDRYDEGKADPEFTFDHDKLPDVSGGQQTLPGIEEAPKLSEETQTAITDELVKAFNDEAESNAQDADPPNYLSDNVEEYQGEYWENMSDRDKYDWAERNGELPEYPIEDDDEETAHAEPVEASDPQRDALMKLAQSSDPKSLWAIADSSQGKSLLLGTSWSGVLNLKDKQTMDRFHAYVGK